MIHAQRLHDHIPNENLIAVLNLPVELANNLPDDDARARGHMTLEIHRSERPRSSDSLSTVTRQRSESALVAEAKSIHTFIIIPID